MPKKERRIFFIVILAAFFLWGGGRVSFAQIEKAPSFALEDIAGNKVALDDVLANNKVVLVHFWATWAPYCRKEIPDLIRLQSKYAPEGLLVLGVNTGEAHSAVSAADRKYHFNYPILMDKDTSVGRSYGVVGIPRNFLVGRKREILKVFSTLNNAAEEAIEKALKDGPKKPGPNSAEALFEQGRKYYEKGNVKPAIVSYEGAIRMRSKYAEAYYNLGAIYHETGKDKESIEAFSRFLELKPFGYPELMKNAESLIREMRSKTD